MVARVLLFAATVACGCAVIDFATADDARAILKTRILLREGASLTADEITDLEAHLADNPMDLSARTRLLGYWGDLARYREPPSKTRVRSLLLWLIHNEPKSEVLSILPSTVREFDPHSDPEGFVEGKQAFLAHLEKEPNDLTLLQHTVDFLGLNNRSLVIELLERAQSVDSSNPNWTLKLGFTHYLDIHSGSGEPNIEAARSALGQYERAYELLDESRGRSSLQYATEAAIVANDLDKAGEYAYSMLEANRPGSHHGDNIHFGNITLGRIALAQGDTKGAASYLLLAGSTPGSPQLNWFGPDTKLAKKLLETGEHESVLQYFSLCAKFWKRGGDQLREWEIVVQGGGIPRSPDFGR